MQFICVIKASYTLGFLMTKNPWLVFRMKHKSSKQNNFVYSFMEKMLPIELHSIEKMLFIQFHSIEKTLILLFSNTYFYSMKLYERV